MGKRTQQRIAISLPVIVRGLDSRGRLFEVSAVAREVSSSGACVDSLNGLAQLGAKIEIQCQELKAWYHVQWVGQKEGPKAGWTGVRCLQPEKNIWGVTPKKLEADTYSPAARESLSRPDPTARRPAAGADVGSRSQSGQERRQFPRHGFRFDARVTPEDQSVRLTGTITDIALGGCYVETLSPLPVDTEVELSFKFKNAALSVNGKVSSSQTGFGMGVMFTRMSPQDFEKLRELLMSTEGSPKRAPAPANPPATQWLHEEPRLQGAAHSPSMGKAVRKGTADVAETLDALVRILCRKQVLTRDEILEELERLRPLTL